MPDVPILDPDELARRLDRGDPVQILDVRASERVAQSRVTFGAALRFQAMPNSTLFALPSLDPLGLDPAQPVAVICGHGNSSRQTTAFLRARGFEAYSVAGGMARWETVYVARRLTPTPRIQQVIQVDRVGKGCLSYVLASDGDAVIVDPGRHLERYEAILRELDATPVAVADTHVHADYLSGAPRAAARWGVPYFLHPDDARSPYDNAPGRLNYRPLEDGDHIAFGRALLRAVHVPGHTLGSLTLIADEELALTGDFVFVASIGRPDLGGQTAAWARLLWQSVVRVRQEWRGDLLVLPAHYAGESERRADRTVGARFDVILATNEPVRIGDEESFVRWIAQRQTPIPQAYRTLKLANLGLLTLSDADVETVEIGPNLCAV
ncbi:MAG TPA: MBL fold metallo-hydrolase [Gemmatimonadales bacterium]|nr:MBL fold metallo-hydrolase [Gemmatimonadales bacterium]